jgi:L-ascorbate metabolism protein UlaG (beta-lactamase superfamily)
MMPAVISGITIASVSESNQTSPTTAAATPTRSQAEKPRSRIHFGAAKTPLKALGSTPPRPAFPPILDDDMNGPDTLTYVGHATVLIELDGTRLLTDPVLRRRVGPLVRHGAMPVAETTRDLDAVLVSHLHRDHADLGSLRRLGRELPLLVPPGSRRFFERQGFSATTELAPGESAEVGQLTVTAVKAHHEGGRRRLADDPEAIGFLVGGSRSVYFAGDTDLFDGMSEIDPDLALLPIWGWGPTLGPGHLDPEGAARATSVLQPRIAVPIHWGTLYPLGLAPFLSRPLRDPAREFAANMGELAPQVETRVLSPGESTSLA